MKFTFVLPGRLKEDYLRAAFQEYFKRLSAFGSAELVTVPECGYKKEPNPNQIAQGLEEEGRALLKTVGERDFLLLLDLRGLSCDSLAFAAALEAAKVRGYSSFVVMAGGSYGLSDAVRRRADLSLKLSDLTLTHPLALLFAVEQVYRAFKINSGSTYHK